MTRKDLPRVFVALRKEANKHEAPMSEQENRYGDPFRVLAGVLLSARTKDETTGPAVSRLFAVAPTPERIFRLSQERIEELIFPVGFYHTKAKHLKTASKKILQDFGGKVPATMQELLTIPGIGRKSANLILAVAFAIPAICVDTHVHRITNRWGYVQTRNPLATEMALREKLPEKYWIEINRLLVIYGQKVCTPLSPFCTRCSIGQYCDRVGVTKTR